MAVAKELEVADIIRQGVYVHVGGPNYESPAECKMLRMLGADVVGKWFLCPVCFCRDYFVHKSRRSSSVRYIFYVVPTSHECFQISDGNLMG